MTSKYIEQCRNSVITSEAKELFDRLITIVASKSPATSYEIELPRQAAKELDDQIFAKTKELFLEINVSLQQTVNEDCVCFTLSDSKEIPTQSLAPLYWSRAPGKFVNKNTGDDLKLTIKEGSDYFGPVFTGTVREWYETLMETLFDASNSIQKKLGEKPTTVRVSPNVLCIIECSILYKPSFSYDGSNQLKPITAGKLVNLDIISDESLPKNVARLTHVKDGTRYTLDVNVTDMDII